MSHHSPAPSICSSPAPSASATGTDKPDYTSDTSDLIKHIPKLALSQLFFLSCHSVHTIKMYNYNYADAPWFWHIWLVKIQMQVKASITIKNVGF